MFSKEKYLTTRKNHEEQKDERKKKIALQKTKKSEKCLSGMHIVKGFVLISCRLSGVIVWQICVFLFVVKLEKCPMCDGIINDFWINFEEKITMCKNIKCPYPYGTENFIIKTFNEKTNNDQIDEGKVSSNNTLSFIDNDSPSRSLIDMKISTDPILQENLSPLNYSTSTRNTLSEQTTNELEDLSFFEENMDLFN